MIAYGNLIPLVSGLRYPMAWKPCFFIRIIECLLVLFFLRKRSRKLHTASIRSEISKNVKALLIRLVSFASLSVCLCHLFCESAKGDYLPLATGMVYSRKYCCFFRIFWLFACVIWFAWCTRRLCTARIRSEISKGVKALMIHFILFQCICFCHLVYESAQGDFMLLASG